MNIGSREGRPSITIYDISEKSGVSIATVSRVINGSKAVSKATREKVLRVIADCGYTPNAFARGLGLNTMRTIGILCADVSDPFMAQAVSFLEKGLRAHEYDTLLCCTGPLWKDRRNGVELLLSKNVDGIVLVGSNYVGMDKESNTYILDAAQKTKVIILNARLDGENIYCVYCDDKAATMAATTALLEAGSRRVLYLYHSRSYSGMKKLDGYRQAYTEADIPSDPALEMECTQENGVHGVMRCIQEAAERGLAFDSVMTSSDDLAVAALKYAQAEGLCVPEDFQIVGFNNLSLCECTEPELSSVDNKLQSLCQTCVSTLMGVLAGEERPKLSVFSGEFVRRGTTLARQGHGA